MYFQKKCIIIIFKNFAGSVPAWNKTTKEAEKYEDT
jgi:hypothetical protein